MEGVDSVHLKNMLSFDTATQYYLAQSVQLHHIKSHCNLHNHLERDWFLCTKIFCLLSAGLGKKIVVNLCFPRYQQKIYHCGLAKHFRQKLRDMTLDYNLFCLGGGVRRNKQQTN